MDLIEALTVFRRVVERRSFAGAARDLGVSQAKITRTVQALERRFAAELIRRSSREMSLTPSGRALYEAADAVLAAAASLRQAVADDDRAPVCGQLRITAPSGFGTLVLAPLIAAMTQDNPALTIELLCTDHYLDLVAENIDLAYRIGTSRNASLVQRAVARVPEVLVAATAYLAKVAEPLHPQELAAHPFVGLSILRDGGRELPLTRGGEQVLTRPRVASTFDTPLAVREALLAGGGCGRIHRYLVESDLRDGALRIVLPEWTCPVWTMALVKTARPRPRAAAFVMQRIEQAIAGVGGLLPAS